MKKYEQKRIIQQILSIMLVMCMLCPLFQMPIYAVSVDNVTTTEKEFSVALEVVKSLGIFKGYPDGSMGENNKVTRAEMATIATRLLGLENDWEAKYTVTKTYPDVSENHWAVKYLSKAYEATLAVGDPDGNFRPDDDVTLVEAIKMILVAGGHGYDKDNKPLEWYEGYKKVAKELKMLDGVSCGDNEAVSRGAIILMVYKMLLSDVTMPETSLEEGIIYAGIQKIRLSTDVPNAKIYYTLDGSEPNSKSSEYKASIIINETTTLKAITVKDGVLFSDVLTVTYKISDEKTSDENKNSINYFNPFGSLPWTNGIEDRNNNGFLTINTDGFTVIDNSKAIYLVDYKIDLLSGTAPENITELSIRFEFLDFEIKAQQILPSKNWQFNKPPLLLGENQITITATTNNGNIISTSITLMNTVIENEDNLEFDISDEDGDGIPNWLEDIYATDRNNSDTDGDGLTDYEEISITYTNPLLVDTDGNSIYDSDEDFDEDGLSNIIECQYGTSPYNADTDSDGIGDYDEIYIYKTDPLNPDTDGDGALDGWEITNGYDALLFNSSFIVKEEIGDVSKENPISATVQIELMGNQINSLNINYVSTANNSLISPYIPGYLGNAYDFYVDGNFNYAILTFEYDISLGVISNDFQPRIYYFNEEYGTLEELPNQTVENGRVTVTINHFSTYILLNKVDFDIVWETEIKPPFESGSGNPATLDIAFVVDVSGSMSSYSRLTTAQSALNSFLDVMSTDDRAALIRFADSATTMSNLTTDKNYIKSLVSSLYASGGTAIYNGFRNALDILTIPNETYGYKMIIILTDGADEPSTTYAGYYASLVDTAVANNIVVYTIGAGTSVNTSILTQIALNTGGAYFAATSTSDITDSFYELRGETIDLVTDSNNDGIPDYYNDLIMNGDLRLSNGSDEFMGINYNNDIDYDNDGLLNGEELKIVTRSNKVYLQMISNPLMKHSDGDGIDDYTEVKNGTDPLRYSLNKTYSDHLMNDSYYYSSKVDYFDESVGYQLTQAANAVIYGVWDPGELYRDQIINYFYLYSGDEYINQMTYENTRITVIDNITKWISEKNQTLKDIKDIVDNLADSIEYLPVIQELASLTKESTELISRINALIPSSDYSQLTRLLDNELLSVLKKIDDLDSTASGTFQFKINGIAKKYSDIMGKNVGNSNIERGTAISIVLDIVNTGIDITDTIIAFSKLNANSAAFERNFDILEKLRNSGNRKFTRDAAQTVINALGKGYTSYGEELAKAIAADTAEGCINIAISIIAQGNPYVQATKSTIDVIAIITGIKPDIIQMYEMICLYDMTQATTSLFLKNVSREGSYYSALTINPSDPIRYLTHIAQMRIVGERKYIDYMETDGLWGGFINWLADYDKIVDNTNKSISNVKSYAQYLKLVLSKSL